MIPRVRVLYEDRADVMSADEFLAVAEDRILKVTVLWPTPRHRLTCIGWDLYLVERLERATLVAVADVDLGSVNRGKTISAFLRDDGTQSWVPLAHYSAAFIESFIKRAKRGVWVPDDTARELGLVL